MPSAECSGLHWRPIVIVITISISTESFYAAGFGSKHRQPSHENCIMSKQPSKDKILEAVAFADEDGVVPPVIAQLAAEGNQQVAAAYEVYVAGCDKKDFVDTLCRIAVIVPEDGAREHNGASEPVSALGEPLAAAGDGTAVPESPAAMRASLSANLATEIKTYASRAREWYGWHFPEMSLIVPDDVAYSSVVIAMGDRANAATADFTGILDESTAALLRSAAVNSMGTELGETDVETIKGLCRQILDLTKFASDVSK